MPQNQQSMPDIQDQMIAAVQCLAAADMDALYRTAGVIEARVWLSVLDHDRPIEALQMLVKIGDARHRHSAPLRAAIIVGSLAAVSILIPVSDPNTMDGEPLNLAADDWTDVGPELVKLLLPASDPKIFKLRPFETAIAGRRIDNARLLLPSALLSDPADLEALLARQGAVMPSEFHSRIRDHLDALSLVNHQAVSGASPEPPQAV